MSKLEAEHSGLMTHVYAKIVVDPYMSSFDKSQAEEEWKQFKKDGDNLIKLIRTPEDKK